MEASGHLLERVGGGVRGSCCGAPPTGPRTAPLAASASDWQGVPLLHEPSASAAMSVLAGLSNADYMIMVLILAMLGGLLFMVDYLNKDAIAIRAEQSVRETACRRLPTVRLIDSGVYVRG